jgi:hypothetical protein
MEQRRAHVAGREDRLIVASPLSKMVGDWREFLDNGIGVNAGGILCLHERTGRPLGRDDFMTRWKASLPGYCIANTVSSVGAWMPEVEPSRPYYFGDASGLTTWIDERLFMARVLDARLEDLDYVGTQCRLLFEIKTWASSFAFFVM